MRVSVAGAGVVAVGLALAATLGCRGQGAKAPDGPPAMGVARATSSLGGPGVQPGIHPAVVFGNLKNPYAGDRTAAAAGRQLFLAYNCYGCHGGRAGGGMGPSLRDSANTYGSTDTQLFATINEGRPAGMPAWGGRIPENQIWQIITYLRTLRTPQEPDRVQVAQNEVPKTTR